MSIHMWSTECRANRQPSDGRCSNILHTAWNYCHTIFRSLDHWSPRRPNIHFRQWCVWYSGLCRSAVNFLRVGYANLLSRKCLWWFFSNVCNAFNCEHPQMCFSRTCLIYITLDQIKDDSISQSSTFMKIPILISAIFLFHLVFAC